jgi:hypothetical protein
MGWLFWNLIAHSILGEEDSLSPPHWLKTAVIIAVWKEGESPERTLRSRLSLNDDPSLCPTLRNVSGYGKI